MAFHASMPLSGNTSNTFRVASMSPIKEFEEGKESFQGDKAGARRNGFSIREFEEGEARI